MSPLERETSRREGVDSLVQECCRSAASFIAEIDSNSEDVAAYLEQRFAVALRAHYFRNGREALEVIAQDGRKLKR
jgi:hypothetical protein